jgi:hypothetical protein
MSQHRHIRLQTLTSRTIAGALGVAAGLVLELALAGAAHAQTGTSAGQASKPAAAVDELRIQQPGQHASADALVGLVNGKLGFRAAGAPRDLVVIRLADGSVFATATMEELAMGLVGDHKVPVEPGAEIAQKAARAGKGANPTLSTGKRPVALAKPKPQGASKPGSGGVPEIGPETGGPTPHGEGGIAGAPEIEQEEQKLVADFIFASIPAAFHGGSVSIYRGAQLIDRDRIILH